MSNLQTQLSQLLDECMFPYHCLHLRPISSLLDSLLLTVVSVSALLTVVLEAVPAFSVHFTNISRWFTGSLLLLLFNWEDPQLCESKQKPWASFVYLWASLTQCGVFATLRLGTRLFTSLLLCFVLAQSLIISSWSFIVKFFTVPALNSFL